jgi:hypothetical protein
MLVREHHTQGRATDAITAEQMKTAPREAPVYAEEVGYDADVDVHKDGDFTTLAWDVAKDIKDLAVLKEASAMIEEVL